MAAVASRKRPREVSGPQQSQISLPKAERFRRQWALNTVDGRGSLIDFARNWGRGWEQDEAPFTLFDFGSGIDGFHPSQGLQEVAAKIDHACVVGAKLATQILPARTRCRFQAEHSIRQPLVDVEFER